MDSAGLGSRLPRDFPVQPSAVRHDEAGVQFLGRPARREAAAQKLPATYDLNLPGAAPISRKEN